MKNITLLSILLNISFAFSQGDLGNLTITETIVPLETWNGYTAYGEYYKDVNDVLNEYEGTWLYSNGNTSLKIILQKRLRQPYFNNTHIDMLVGEYQYIENGVEKINTLANINSQENSISESDILTTPFLGDCTDCLPNEKRVSVGFSDSVAELHGEIFFKKMVVNGQEAIRASIYYTRNYFKAYMPSIPPGNNEYDYILIKQ